MSSPQLSSGLFIAGTDTNVGKTFVASLIVRTLRSQGVRVGAYKPACSGAIPTSSGMRWEDIDRLRDALAQDVPDEAICPQRFLTPLAPHLAARAEGRTVDSGRLVSGMEWWRDRADFMVVEGAGGLLSPISDSETVADVARTLSLPLVIVARCGLGTINHSLLTIEAARNRDLAIAGIVLNQSRPDDDLSLANDNADEIESRGDVRVLGIIDRGSVVGLQRHGSPVTIPWLDLQRSLPCM